MNLPAEETLGGVALVTGAARRIGAEIARELHQAGMQVLVHCHRSRDEAHALAETLNWQRADSAAVLEADLADPAAIVPLAEAAMQRWGRLDLLVNNASQYRRTPFGELTRESVDALVRSNFTAPLFLTQACVERFGDSGCVINILDTLARHARPGFAPYNAAKAALWSLTETLALELAPRVRVNGVAPGHTLWTDDVPMTPLQQAREEARIPLQRLGEPADIARIVRLLASPRSGYITGAIVPVDGGLRLR